MIVVRQSGAPTHSVGDGGERIGQPGWTTVLLLPGDDRLAVDDPPVGAGLDGHDVQTRWTPPPVLMATVPVDDLLVSGRLPVAQPGHEASFGIIDPHRQQRRCSRQAAMDPQALDEGIGRQFEVDTTGHGRHLVGAVRAPWRASDP